jgi:hypothetical protein
MDFIHQKLNSRFKLYSKWHNQPYHAHHHWLSVILAAVICTAAIFSAWQVSPYLYSVSVSAQTSCDITALSGETDDLSDALSSADPGQVVCVPPGDWTFNGTARMDSGVILRGDPAGVILRKENANSEYMITVDCTEKEPLTEISGISFIDSAGSTSGAAIRLNDSCIDFKIHNNRFESVYNGILIYGDARGVIYENTFSKIPFYGVVIYGDGQASWNASLVLGDENAVFVEDNLFELGERHHIASNWGSKYVFRYNTINDETVSASAIDAHGPKYYNQSGVYVGSRSYEIYENKIDVTRRWVGSRIRGGDGVIFNNHYTGSIDDATVLAIESHDDQCETDPNNYPCPDQITDAYIWGETVNGQPGTIDIEDPAFLIEGRDYHLSQKPGYTSYTYPHPLRDGSTPLPPTTGKCGDGNCNSPTETCSNCEADCGVCTIAPDNANANLNCSGVVDIYDFGILMSCWGTAYNSSSPLSCAPNASPVICNSPDISAGANNESLNKVDVNDYGELMGCWGTTCEGSTAPAPYCGDGDCNNGETSSSCPGDCGGGGGVGTCGDGNCDLGEDSSSCLADCPVAGDPGDCTKFVARNADGNGDGSAIDDAWTINQAFSQAQPGSIVCFRGGTYESEGSSDGFEISANGNSSNRIVFRNYPGEQPVIDGTNSTSWGYYSGVRVDGDYVTMYGFEIRNFHYTLGLKVVANNFIFENNYVHDNADHSDETPSKCGTYNEDLCRANKAAIGDVYGGNLAECRCGDGLESLDYTSNMIIRDNVFWGNGTSHGWDHNIYIQGTNHIVDRNIIAYASGNGVSIRLANSIQVTHNTTYYNFSSGIASNYNDNVTVYNNIIMGGENAMKLAGGTDNDYGYNLIYSTDNWGGDGEAFDWGDSTNNTIEANPQFVDPPTSKNDTSYNFMIGSDSSAIDTGLDWGQGYIGDAPDRGKFEFGI